jgi:hypothetical protein
VQTIYKAANITEAHIVRGMLNARGIDAEVSGHYLQGGVGELATMDFAQVLVEEEDIALARNVINEYEANTHEQTETAYSPLSTRSVLIFMAVLLGLIGLISSLV